MKENQQEQPSFEEQMDQMRCLDEQLKHQREQSKKERVEKDVLGSERIVRCAAPKMTEEEIQSHEQRRLQKEKEEAECARTIEESEKKKKQERWFKEANLPERHEEQERVFGPLKGEKWHAVFTKIKNAIGKRGAIIALVGERGPGKTQLAVEACRHMIFDLDKCAMYYKTMRFFSKIRGMFNENKNEDEVLKVFMYPQLFILDELSARSETQWENNTLDIFIDERYDKKKDTILIANLAPEKFSEYVGSSITSRIRQTGGIIHCDWESFRK